MKKLKLISILTVLSLTLLCMTSCGICFHDYKDTVISPSCLEEGKTVRICQKCGNTKETDIVPANGHSYEMTVYPPDCDSEGYTEYVCFCGHSYRVDVIVPVGHQLSPVVTEPICDKLGFTTNTCSVCDYTFTDSYVEPKGHSFEMATVAPTCTEQGYTTYRCACGYSYKSDFVAAKGHDLKTTVTAPTCDEQGYETYLCECGFTYRSNFKEPHGHEFTSKVTVPTCTDGGYTVYSCSCGYSYTADIVSPTGHSLEKKVTAPTCTAEGFTTYTCDCGYTFESELVAPKGHCFKEQVTMPTVSEYGYTVFTCHNCLYKYTGSFRFYSDILDNAYANNATVVAKGVDISKYQHKVDSIGSFLPLDFDALRADGAEFAILKIGSTIRGSRGGLEPTFEADYAAAKEAGVDVGVYFYTYATTVEQIRLDAEWMLTHLEGKQFEYPIYLDLEDESLAGLGGPLLTEMCMEFFSVLQKAGYYTGLYVNNEWLRNILQTEKMLDNFEIWYARYPSDAVPVWNVTEYGAHLGMWQYSDKGVLPSFPEIPFDLNYAYKDYPALIKYHGFNGFEKTK